MTETFDQQAAQAMGTNGQVAAPRTPEQLIGAAADGQRPPAGPRARLRAARAGLRAVLPAVRGSVRADVPAAAVPAERGTDRRGRRADGGERPGRRATPTSRPGTRTWASSSTTTSPSIRSSSLDRQNDPDALTDFRSPALRPRLHVRPGPHRRPVPVRDRPPAAAQHADRPARRRGRPAPQQPRRPRCMGDPRNDENIFVSAAPADHARSSTTRCSTGSRPTRRCGAVARPSFEAAQRHRPLALPVDGRCTTSCRGAVGTGDAAARSSTTQRRRCRCDRDFYHVEERRRTCRWSSRSRPTGSGTRQVRGRLQAEHVGARACRSFTADHDPDHRLGSFGGFRILPPLWTIEWRAGHWRPAADR